jgi:aminoglycoside phosphotransferase (APT) family kinase protein
MLLNIHFVAGLWVPDVLIAMGGPAVGRAPAYAGSQLAAGRLGVRGTRIEAGATRVNEGSPTPDISTFLLRLSRTVRDTLAQRADPGFLADQLYTLSSILKILGTVSATIEADNEADVRDLLQVLEQTAGWPGAAASGPPPELPRAALAGQIASGSLLASPDPAVSGAMRQYLQADLARSYVGLLGPAPAVPPTAAALAATEFTAAEEQARTRLLAVLGERLAVPEATPDRVEFAAEAAAGYAAETRQVTVWHGAAKTADFIVRLQWPHNLMTRLARTVDVQAAVMPVVAEAGVAVAGVILAEPDPAVCGTPFIVSEYVPGYVPTPWTAQGREFTDRLRPVQREPFMAELVAIHSVDWQDSRLALLVEGPTPAEHQRNRVSAAAELYHEVALRPDPLIEEVLAYLRDELPPVDGLVIVHGDYRPGNIIYDPQTLARKAVIDWDGVHLGNYHEDLGQILAWPFRDAAGLACGLYQDDELLAMYEQLSGRAVRRADVHYYELAATFRRYIGFCVLARSWLDGGGDVRMARAWLALSNDRVQLARLLGIDMPRG